MSDISGILGGMGVSLEAEAFKVFGAAVEGKISPVLEGVLGNGGRGNINQNPNPPGGDPTIGIWDPTPYASALTSGQAGFDVKTKFLFKVHFNFTPQAGLQAASLTGGRVTDIAQNLTFAIKQIDLPKYSFEYDEVNMYNFRTKVLRKINHEGLKFVMYDTAGNHAQDFLNLYLKLLMPLNRREWSVGSELQDYGLEFSNDYIGGMDSSMRQALQGNTREILSSIVIEQFYLSRDNNLKGNEIRQAIKLNKFTFLNPRILAFDLEDQDHEKGSDPGTVNCNFDFDALYMATGLDADIRDKDDTGFGTYDILSGQPIDTTKYTGTRNSAGGGKPSLLAPFIDIVANQGARAIGSQVSTAINKAGMGKIAGGALSGVAGSVSTAFSSRAASTLKTIGTQTIGNISLGRKPKITDNSTPPIVAQNNTSQIFPTDDIA